MKIRFSIQIPKIPERPDLNEDVLLFDEEQAVICDGASESFDSRTWAHMLAKAAFAKDFIPSGETFDALADEYASNVNYAVLSWSKQAAFDRGSFSTLLKASYKKEESRIQVTAVGDSEFFLLSPVVYDISSDPRLGTCSCVRRYYRLLHCQPYKSSAEFSRRPGIISTLKRANAVFSAEYMASSVQSYEVKRGGYALLMSDALAAWSMKKYEQGKPVWDKLLSFTDEDPKSKEEFLLMVKDLRSRHELKVDDTTLLIMEF